jgi:hypothetical protein
MTKRKTPPRPRRMALQLTPEDVADLETIVGLMRKDRKIPRLRGRLGREKAVRYAIWRVIDRAGEGG